jgi:hypothetical protein
VILDLTLPDSDGIETISQFASRLTILILSRADTEEIAKDAVRRYLVKTGGNRLRWHCARCRILAFRQRVAGELERVPVRVNEFETSGHGI